MPSMRLSTSQGVLAATESLPSGATLVIHDCSWESYEQLLDSIGDRPGLRISYDHGRLEILSPSRKHERYSRIPDLIVAIYCEIRGLKCELYGHTTWKLKGVSKGVEPDACYYVRNAERVIGETEIRLESHPPPDIAVEIDMTNSSLQKFVIYSALSVPEIWRFDGRTFTFYALEDGKYAEIPESRQLPGFTGAMLLEAIQDSETRGQTSALKAFRQRLRK